MLRKFFFTALSLAAVTAYAAGKKPVLDVNQRTDASQIAAIQAQLDDGKTYVELGGEQKSQVKAALLRISDVLNAHADLTGMPESTRVALFNDQELVNNLLVQARDDSRLICSRDKLTGSNMRTTQCSTVAERRRIKENSQHVLAEGRRDLTKSQD
ncbi:hypothetical protein JR065_21100 [Xanthomonas sp. AmX2]|uniref:hypothetical protein n=1 Tax=Xanthomonas sp. TaxID=29446 RepID=UPI001981861A|nr:hypothetical protein [Xanthomonas sp.]MBN6152833.1 hypothetical protein [Xanthomonas sp.]